MSGSPTIMTVGHSNKPIGDFIDLLHTGGVEVLVDCRTKPASRFSPQFNRKAMQAELEANGIRYEWRGNNLGGLAGNVDYDQTIDEYANRAMDTTFALCCSEKDLKNCHRKSKLTPSFKSRGLSVIHLLWGADPVEEPDDTPKAPVQEGMF